LKLGCSSVQLSSAQLRFRFSCRYAAITGLDKHQGVVKGRQNSGKGKLQQPRVQTGARPTAATTTSYIKITRIRAQMVTLPVDSQKERDGQKERREKKR